MGDTHQSAKKNRGYQKTFQLGVIVGMMRVDKNNAPLSEQGIVGGKDHEIFHCFQS